MESREGDPLRPALERAQETLAEALAEACAADVNRADTGELIRVEEMLAIAGEAAKQAVSIRRKLGRDREGTSSRKAGVRDAGVRAPAPTAAEQLDVPPPEGHRAFRDARGISWSAFAVHPTADASSRARLPEPYRSGWLAFEAPGEKRRLSPVPDGWQSMAEGELAALCQQADVVPRRTGSRGEQDEE